MIIHIWCNQMSKSTTVSAKVPTELKERAQELGINISNLTRESLRDEVEKRERELLKKQAKEAGKILEKIPREDIVKVIRETRESS